MKCSERPLWEAEVTALILKECPEELTGKIPDNESDGGTRIEPLLEMKRGSIIVMLQDLGFERIQW